jgi:hypothetical protein
MSVITAFSFTTQRTPSLSSTKSRRTKASMSSAPAWSSTAIRSAMCTAMP